MAKPEFYDISKLNLYYRGYSLSPEMHQFKAKITF